jgi:hypothetical protein
MNRSRHIGLRLELYLLARRTLKYGRRRAWIFARLFPNIA